VVSSRDFAVEDVTCKTFVTYQSASCFACPYPFFVFIAQYPTPSPIHKLIDYFITHRPLVIIALLVFTVAPALYFSQTEWIAFGPLRGVPLGEQTQTPLHPPHAE
jgi:hypothetical protein